MTWILKSWSLWTRHEITLVLALLVVAGAALCLVAKLARPQPLEDTVMGDRWQCSKTAFVITTCTKRPKQAIARVPDAFAAYVDAR
jgi:hypothetical protein